jgi:transcriptional regulator with GAF, ATPase, and Fis domain
MSSAATNSVSSLVQSIGEIPPEAVVFGNSDAMLALRDRLSKVAAANVPVLIHGESGTGKDIIARMVHTISPWKTGPFVKVNGPAFAGSLLES